MGRIETLGLHNKISELRSITPNTERRKWKKIDCSSAPLRRSNRLKGIPLEDPLHGSREGKTCGDNEGKRQGGLDVDEPHIEMEEVRAACNYEDLRKARILENKARLESLGLQKTISELRSISGKPILQKRKRIKIDYSAGPLRRSTRLKAIPLNCPTLDGSREGKPHGEDDCKYRGNLDVDEPRIEMEEVKVTCDYEDLRKARILENKARLKSLGLQKTISELRSISEKPKLQKRKLIKTEYSLEQFRRSTREKSKMSNHTAPVKVEEDEYSEYNAHRPLPYALDRRCSSKARGSVYDPVYGICCHFCRQKKLCGEDDCKHCGDLDLDQPCIGKTDCSFCHSTNGVLCRACLKVRYGEEMEEVRSNKEWMCPHCVEDKGINPYWICNSSFCLKKRRMAPTGIAIYRAREMGYKSVAHLLMDELKK
ncbi:unnamed protein product [Cuscuta campestris]|uniref:Zinc-finger domain-containing protein n=1 Tax=Cuscuta campestris TaxID=132261 RepID=A0A484MGG3_9ASTE|nr:unnamed protein product [Cuscuta campestris]